MARGGREANGRGFFARIAALIASLALFGSGVALGVVAATVWPTPGIVRDWIRGPVETVVLGSTEPSRPTPLDAFRDLQGGRRRALLPAPSPAPPPLADVAAEPSREERELSMAERVVADLEQSTRARPGPSPTAAGSRGQPPALEEAPAPSPGVDGQGVVQVGSYLERRAADAVARRLARDGFDAYVSDAKAEGKARFRVRVRPAKGQTPDGLSEVLRAGGYSVWVIRE